MDHESVSIFEVRKIGITASSCVVIVVKVRMIDQIF